MLRPRIIPCLLLENGDLVKTVKFKPSKYIGDPLNAIRIFNEKAVDELIVLDISASMQGRQPDFRLVANMAAECQMPFCYGGGIHSLDQVETLISLGVEKVAFSSAAIADPTLVTQAAAMVGSQSVVVVLDVALRAGRYEVVTHRGMRPTGLSAVETARHMATAGAGEIVINSVDRDGTMTGYDMALVSQVRRNLTIPTTFVGGAGTLDHIGELVRACGQVGAAAGSLFVFKGVYRAVLINYPNQAQKRALLCEAMEKCE